MTRCQFFNMLVISFTCLIDIFKLIMVKYSALNQLSFYVIISEFGINYKVILMLLRG